MSKIPTDYIQRDSSRSDDARLETIYRRTVRTEKYGQVRR